MTAKRILIVDDHDIVADAMRSLIEDGLKRLGFKAEVRGCTTARQAASLLLQADPFDLIMLDLSLPDLPREARPPALSVYIARTLVTTPVLVVSGSDDDATIEQCKAAGARGFLSKAAAGSGLIGSVIAALEPGEFFQVTPFNTSNTMRPPQHLGHSAQAGFSSTHAAEIEALGLTPRQLEVLNLMVDGRSNKEIADRLDLSEHTVKVHVRLVLDKLGIERRLQAKEALEARNIVLPAIQDQAA